MNKKTDGYIVRKAEQIDRYLLKIRDAIDDIAQSQHPHADQIVESLDTNGLPPEAWATHCIHQNLKAPDHFESGIWGIRRKKG